MKTIGLGELNCINCDATVKLGCDYCDTCAAAMQSGVVRGECAFCQCKISPYNLDIGFCDCGKPLSNAPPITVRVMKNKTQNYIPLENMTEREKKEYFAFMADMVFDRR